MKWVAGLAAAAGLVAGAVLAAPTGASATDGQPVIAGQDNSGPGTTRLSRPADGQYPDDTTHTLEVARGIGGDYADLNATNRPAIQAWSHSGNETVSVANLTTGVYGGPGLTVQNHGTDLPALVAIGFNSRGARLGGQAAQLQLLPSQSSHPKSGQLGDFFLDKAGKLWFCQGGTKWKQLA